MNRVVVEVEGGLVTAAVTDLACVEVYVVDRDIEGRSEPGDWPGGEVVTAVGGLQDCPSDPARVVALLGEIAQECDHCEGTGFSCPSERQAQDGPCPECEGRGFGFPYAEAAPSAGDCGLGTPSGLVSLDPGCPCGLADRDAPGHEEALAREETPTQTA